MIIMGLVYLYILYIIHDGGMDGFGCGELGVNRTFVVCVPFFITTPAPPSSAKAVRLPSQQRRPIAEPHLHTALHQPGEHCLGLQPWRHLRRVIRQHHLDQCQRQQAATNL